MTNLRRSMSMAKDDIQPSRSSAACGRIITRGINNRLGAVYAALHNFWTARQAASGQQRDANTIILHAQDVQSLCESEKTGSPDDLLALLLPNRPRGGNCFDKALKAADAAILKCWDDTRPPVIIFLSDGIASVSDSVVRSLFRKTAQKGWVLVRWMSNIKLRFVQEGTFFARYLVRSKNNLYSNGTHGHHRA